jgi:hypothetical protein
MLAEQGIDVALPIEWLKILERPRPCAQKRGSSDEACVKPKETTTSTIDGSNTNELLPFFADSPSGNERFQAEERDDFE